VARDVYWRYLKNLFDEGTDAWWMDSTDPDNFDMTERDYDHRAGDATYRRYRNAFPLATVKGVYDHQRALAKNASEQARAAEKRVFIMTRSAFAGQQHYGSGLWSGDVTSTWDVLRRQIPLGLNYSLTGCPNFNTDIGGFFAGRYNRQGSNSAPRNPQYQELYVRWMQYGLFCPVFRSHGTECPREIWEFGRPGEPVYDAIAAQIRLRYRLLPYLYSTAWQVTSNNDSYLRPLFADFIADRRTWEMPDEFMFGRSILAAPIVEAQYTDEEVQRSFPKADFTQSKTAKKYLPKGALWYDFWTGKQYKGGQDIQLTTTLAQVPMFVRAGSILPLGPEMQYVGEKAWDKLELRIYPGADGQFVLYEDEGDNYNYERGKYATIQLSWNNARHTLTIGARKGAFPGMLQQRQFVVVLPDGTSQTVDYNGQEVTVRV
jgi:alpha-D-xyloside xylohydrolase